MYIYFYLYNFFQSTFCRSCDDYMEKFEAETVGVCASMIKRCDEITKEEALERRYNNGRVSFINSETNKGEYVYVAFFL